MLFQDLSKGTQHDQNLMWLAHSSWRSNDNIAINGKLPKLAGAPKILQHAYIPELSAAKLKLAHAAVLDLAGRPHLVVGYSGNRGCRVTLLVTEVWAQATSAPVTTETDGLFQARWDAGKLSYVLLAKGMDLNRFRLLASSISEGSLENRPFGSRTLMALSRSRAESKPCKLA